MDQERAPKHTCCVCSCQLYQWITTYRCHYPMTFETSIQSQFQQMDCICYQIANLQWEGATQWFQDEQSQISNLWMVAFNMDSSVEHGCNDCQRLEKIGITKAFTPDFQVEAMESNALTPLFTFTLKVEKIQWCRK